MKRRKTKSKEAVLSVLKESGTALNHEMIQSELSTKADRATIYRILNQFSEDGVVHQIIGDDGKQYFALCLNCLDKNHNHNHLHFRCEKCGTVECLNNEIDFKLPNGYVSTNFNGVVSGFCLNCS
ncbi:transcriptional repressor [Aquimarina sp. AD10]|uniref:Transcriptional regulator n=1 Tax=Aquimarina aggregata TaxID=1642818 RepID=A0A162CRL0_9FLAO|nr:MULTISPECIES: transcriptional repressor [Aquimarina]AXT59158.1 transcriptional repressor [Aquimarina sp. AD10]KZS41114.1 transcriptional regulator [Aquimarina aggregata]RKM93865.1 transcriptional repressor [Aquimarina sp. AD10]